MPKNKPALLIAEPDRFSHKALEALRAWAEVTLAKVDAGAFRDAFARYDIIVFRLGHRITAAHVGAGRRCRIVATPVTGLDHIDLDACERAGVRVVSLRGETEFLKGIRGTAEMTVALALALIRRLPAAVRSVLNGNWERDPFQGAELYGKTAGIVGVGRLGTIVAGYFQAFGMTVLGYDPHRDFSDSAARPVKSLSELLAQADLISLHVTYQAETRHLINRQTLAGVKPGAILINTSRGGVVEDAALLEALQSGRLAGAALDVVDGEPDVGAAHPLVAYARTHDNLLLTPHVGGNTGESFEKTELFLAERVRQSWFGTGHNPHG